MATESPSLFSPGSWSEGSRIAAVLRKETVGGALLLLATVIAMVWANSPWSDSYFQLLRRRGRAGRTAPEPDAGDLGRRRSAGDLLLRRRVSSSSGSSSPATCGTRNGRWCRSRRRSAG